MFEKFSQIAEQAATSASRRQFLGRLGKGALAAAAAVSGLLVFPGDAEAATTVCGRGSWLACQGRMEGSRCYVGRFVGVCLVAPNCACRIKRTR